MTDGWQDPAHPPTEATDLGGGVWVSWSAPWSRTGADGLADPTIWHWCTGSVILKKPPPPASTGERIPDYYPRWALAAVGAHDLIARDPLHLEPSVHWPGCCGLHGWVREGAWVSC